MKRLALTAALAISAFAALALTAEALKVDAVLKDADKHDGKDVAVTGTVSNYQAKTSRAGNKYATFTLKGANNTLSAYTQGHPDPAPKDGDTVEITGVYRKEKKVSDTYTVKNELDFTKKDKKPYGLKITKKAN